MSQEKVDKYKEEKKNRKARIEKEKKRQKMWKILAPVILIVVVAAVGAFAYFMPKLTNEVTDPSDYQTLDSGELDMDEIMDILNSSVSDNTTVE